MLDSRLKYFVLTGTPGTGKTTLIEFLRAHGQHVQTETAREVLAEQKAIDGPGLPSKSPLRFVQMMLERAISKFENSQTLGGPVFFDRGIPDLIAYAERFGVDASEFQQASESYRYSKTVFVLSPWKEIFVNDSERLLTYEASLLFHESLLAAYRRLGYELIEVPFGTLAERADFVRAIVSRGR